MTISEHYRPTQHELSALSVLIMVEQDIIPWNPTMPDRRGICRTHGTKVTRQGLCEVCVVLNETGHQS